MKQAKSFPFLKIQKQRLQLHIDNASSAQVPSDADFFRWTWQAMKPYYRKAEISLVLLDADEAQAYNRDYRGRDYATNVLSFAQDELDEFALQAADTLYGDLIICPQVVEKEAAEQGKSMQEHYAHLTVHGMLHLIGFDHIEDEEAEEMEALEIRILHQLGYDNPYSQDEQ